LYKPVYSEEALRQILALRPASVRHRILRRIEVLAGQPLTTGELEVFDETGRTNQMVLVSGYAITFWADHPVKELRIVDVTRLNR